MCLTQRGEESTVRTVLENRIIGGLVTAGEFAGGPEHSTAEHSTFSRELLLLAGGGFDDGVAWCTYCAVLYCPLGSYSEEEEAAAACCLRLIFSRRMRYSLFRNGCGAHAHNDTNLNNIFMIQYIFMMC